MNFKRMLLKLCLGSDVDFKFPGCSVVQDALRAAQEQSNSYFTRNTIKDFFRF